ncbi:MAG: heme-copper oxidase subunit III [Rhodospirillaceae bacterium]|nr:heme-copper oxidase subunit III [Rhodospirillaceae bacterium]
MTTDAHSVAHAHHWEWSWAPMAVVAGTFFLLPMTFASHFVYETNMVTIVTAAIGVVFTLAGVAKWVDEGLTETPLIANVSTIGLPIFILSEVFIFLSLFVSYWMMRLGIDSAEWASLLPQNADGTPAMAMWIPAIMTVILVSSSLAIHVGEEKLEHGDLAGFNKWLIITIVLGTIFLGFTIYEYEHLIGLGFIPSTNIYSTAFYTITGFHASHVLIGLAVFIAVLLPSLGGRTNKAFVTCASVYWHFVDVVWFFVASQIYFW